MSELHKETVESGKNAVWPYDKGYKEPTKDGYLFDGWEFDGNIYEPPFDNIETNPFGPINSNTDIKVVWDKLNIYAETNHTLISGDGDTDDNMSKFSYWVQSDKGKKITDNVTLEDVALNDDELPIVFDINSSTSIVDGKNVKTVKVLENDINKPRFYRFKTKYNKESGMESDTIEVKQVGKEQIILPPFDYLTFTYSWKQDDGRDLDSATFVRNSNIPIESVPGKKTLNDIYVGYGGIKDNEEVNQYLIHGGDNTQSGAMINWKKICDRDFISEGINTLYLDVYANWHAFKDNGNMSVSFKTYKGNDGLELDKVNHVFKPIGDTVEVSNKILNGLNVYSFSSTNINNVKKFYSKVATVEYDVRTKSAVLIGEYTRSGREVITTLKYNGEFVENVHSGNITINSLNVDNKINSGSFILSDFTECINGGTVEKYGFKDAARVSDSYGTAVLHKNNDGSANITWSIEANTTGEDRILDVDVNTEDTEAYKSGHTIKLTIHQSK